ncbi:hypothetical protein GOBAR_DD06618 [Gossypium barbadense]|nr:hypothetical protein GOBAR_DD06618 [Gossypium barbadense]
MDQYLDLDYSHVDPKMETQDQEQNNFGTNGVVPILRNTIQAPMVTDHCYNMDFTSPKSFPYYYNYNPHSLSHNYDDEHINLVHESDEDDQPDDAAFMDG